jgi:hypothetical protein
MLKFDYKPQLQNRTLVSVRFSVTFITIGEKTGRLFFGKFLSIELFILECKFFGLNLCSGLKGKKDFW